MFLLRATTDFPKGYSGGIESICFGTPYAKVMARQERGHDRSPRVTENGKTMCSAPGVPKMHKLIEPCRLRKLARNRFARFLRRQDAPDQLTCRGYWQIQNPTYLTNA